MIKDFKTELDEMRKNFVLHKNRIHLPARPYGIKPSDQEADIYRLGKEIVKSGNVYYGSIVVGNHRLFTKPTFDDLIVSDYGFHASLLFSRDKIAEYNPFLVKKIAREISTARDSNDPVPSEFEEIVAIISDGRRRETAHLLIEREQERLSMEFVNLTVFLPFLPNWYVKCPLLPIIASPYIPEHALVLPKQLWSKNFKRAWNEIRF